MSKSSEKRAKKKVKKRYKADTNDAEEPGLDLKCIVEGCKSNKSFPSLLSLASHIRAAHRKQYTAKQMERLLMSSEEKVKDSTTNSEEMTKVSDQKAKDDNVNFDSVLAKIEEVNNKIPANLCERFPELCKLGNKVDKLSVDMEGLKGNQIKKLVLQVPKQEDPPKVDLSITDSKLEVLSNSMIDVNNKLDKLSNEDKRPQTKHTKKSQETKKEEKGMDQSDIEKEGQEKSDKDIVSMVKDSVNKAVQAAKIGSDHHKEVSADEIVNCPHCRKKILDKIVEQSNNSDNLDPSVMNFMESMGFVKKEEERGKRDDNKETNNDKSTDERSLSRSAQPGTETRNVADKEVPKPEANGSEQRTQSEQRTAEAETESKGSGAENDEGQSAETKAEGNSVSDGAGSGDDRNNEPESGQSYKPREPKRCRLLFRPER